MQINVSDYIDVSTKCKDLGFEKAANVCMLPNNLTEISELSEGIHFSSATTLKKLLAEKSISSVLVEPTAGDRKYLVQKSIAWYGPILLFTIAELSQNPQLLSVSLGVISNYLAERFAGNTVEESQVELSVVVEKTKTKTTRKLDYKGPIEGLKVLEERVLKEVASDSSD